MRAAIHEDLTRRIIGAAIAVHRELGPGFLESVYEGALAQELLERGIEFLRQVEVPIIYKGVQVGKHRLDLIVEGKVVVELKCVAEFAPIHFSVVNSYLKATRNQVGLLLNFAIIPLGKRRVASAGPATPSVSS